MLGSKLDDLACELRSQNSMVSTLTSAQPRICRPTDVLDPLQETDVFEAYEDYVTSLRLCRLQTWRQHYKHLEAATTIRSLNAPMGHTRA